MIRQYHGQGRTRKQPRSDTDEGWRQVVEGWEIPIGKFPDDNDLVPADFFEPEDLPT